MKTLKRLAIVALMLLSAGVGLAIGVKIKVKLIEVKGHLDERFIAGKFYRRPVHPGFIVQKFPSPTARVAISKGSLSKGLPTAHEYRKRKK